MVLPRNQLKFICTVEQAVAVDQAPCPAVEAHREA